MRHANNWLFEKDPTSAPRAAEDPMGRAERMLIELPVLYWMMVEDGQWRSHWDAFPSSEFTPPGDAPAPTGGYWPDTTQEMLLRAALMDGTDALAAWRAVRPRLAVAEADRVTRRLFPLLGANLRRLGMDDPLSSHFDAIRRATATKNRRLFDAGRRLLAALAEAGIATLVLKGGALAGPRYADIGIRPMSDLDILVPTARAGAAVETLRAAGWSARMPVTAQLVRMFHAVNVRERASAVTCDLHWHAYWECCAPGADDDLWAASQPLHFEGVATRTLGPADQLLHLCVHGSRRARRAHLLWIPDALLVLRAGGIDWPRLVAQARRRHFVLRARTMLRYLEQTFRAPVPEAVLTELETLRVARLERFEYRVGNRPQGVLGELPSYWCNYRRLREDGVPGSPLGFARYLQQTWRLASLGEVAGGALARARNRLGATLVRSATPDPS
jgi:hypothetical protein